MDITKYRSTKFTMKLNYCKIPTNIIPISEEGMEEFNSIIEWVEHNYSKKLVRTPSGGISIAMKNWNHLPGYDIRTTKSCVELTLVGFEGCFRFQFRMNFKDKDNSSDGVSGHEAFKEFTKICEKYGIDITDFKLPPEEGREVKASIPSAIIDLTSGMEDITFRRVHHIDIHSAHMAGMAVAFPELYEPINYCYTQRKVNPVYKGILTHTWGYCQSQYSPVYYGYSHLSKAGIEYTNRTIKDLTQRLKDSGRVVIAHNTDGIWYSGEIYHGDGEGSDLGQWSNDHINCKFRAKSKGCYEFEEDGKYTVVARGRYALDKIKPRDQWQWGDIYNTGAQILYYYNQTTHRIEKESGEI